MLRDFQIKLIFFTYLSLVLYLFIAVIVLTVHHKLYRFAASDAAVQRFLVCITESSGALIGEESISPGFFTYSHATLGESDVPICAIVT